MQPQRHCIHWLRLFIRPMPVLSRRRKATPGVTSQHGLQVPHQADAGQQVGGQVPALRGGGGRPMRPLHQVQRPRHHRRRLVVHLFRALHGDSPP